MSAPASVSVAFGALVDPVAVQLKAQGFSVAAEVVDMWQRDVDALVRLHVRGYLPDSTAHKTRQRIIKKISAAITKARGEA